MRKFDLLLQLELASYAEMAKERVEGFEAWYNHEYQNLGRPQKKIKGRIRPRVNFSAPSLSLTWGRSYYLPKSYSSKTLHIKMAKNGDYSEATLSKYSEDWEIEEVLKLESYFADIRRRSRAIGKLRRNMTYVSKLGVDLDDSVSINRDDLETPALELLPELLRKDLLAVNPDDD